MLARGRGRRHSFGDDGMLDSTGYMYAILHGFVRAIQVVRACLHCPSPLAAVVILAVT